MNVKNKFIALVMSFVICFGTVSNSFAYDKRNITTVSAPLVAVVSSIAVACGVSLNDNSDLYDIVSIFYDKYKDNQEIINTAFDVGVSILKNKVVNVSKDFLELVKSAFDDYKSSTLDLSDSMYFSGYGLSIPLQMTPLPYVFTVGNYVLNVESKALKVLYNDVAILSLSTSVPSIYDTFRFVNRDGRDGLLLTKTGKTYENFFGFTYPTSLGYAPNSMPNFNDYDWDKISDKVEQGSLGLHMPGYLGDLIGKNPSDVVYDGVNSNPYDKPYEDTITLPGVKNPSIDSTLEGTFNPSFDTDVPGTSNPSIPNDSIWSTIKDFVISLVVPSDTFWTDTFNNFRDNFSKNFPMLDMSKFDSLAVGGKPFPNLYAYGSKIVDGDVINSIVDWLRPIIAGFIMICLMFFNYRKIYKLIRNTEPFGGIAQGSSDFRTGLSAPPINNGLDPNPMGNLRDTLFDMRNEILRRENSK